jgi:arylsulfatase A-like enzyme
MAARSGLPLALALLAGACGARPSKGVAPGVLVIVVDALRADHLKAYGYDRDTSPALDELAREGLRFEQVLAAAPLLLPAHAALLTGCEPDLARRILAPELESESARERSGPERARSLEPRATLEGAGERRWGIPMRAPHVAVEFLTAGYATATFVDQELLFEASGFGLGFQHHEFLDPRGAEYWEGPQETRAVDHFLKWLSDVPLDRPWFAYLHVNQLERFWSEGAFGGDGYFQPRPELTEIPPVANTDSVFFAVPRSRWRSGVRTLGQYEAAYDDEIRKVDAEIGRVCASLRRQGRFDSTTVHVLGAFGMQFGEAGMFLSSGRYSMADLSVPWIVHPRAVEGPGRSIPGLVSTLDVAPTLLALEGLALPRAISGLSQAAAVSVPGAPVAERPFVFASCGLQEGCAVIGERHALEYIVPRGMSDAQLRRSWTGEWSDRSLQPRVFCYDRLATPGPPLAGSERGPDPELAPYRAAAIEWLQALKDKRLALEGRTGGAEAGEAVPSARDAGLVEATR